MLLSIDVAATPVVCLGIFLATVRVCVRVWGGCSVALERETLFPNLGGLLQVLFMKSLQIFLL